MVPNADKGGGGQKSHKFCRRHMYTAPNAEWVRDEPGSVSSDSVHMINGSAEEKAEEKRREVGEGMEWNGQ